MPDYSKENPYSIIFGREPHMVINRDEEAKSIIKAFSQDIPSQQAYMITGIRGSGKTVFMSDISDYFSKQKDWICVELSADRDMLQSLAAKLTSDNALARLFKSADINLSLFGIGLTVTGSVPISDIETALSRMLESIKKKGKHVLICIDEVIPNENLKVFCSSFQIFVRHHLPVFMLMTGLYENIEALQNTPNLTFLYRATRVTMNPLNQFTIADSYKDTFENSREDAVKMAAWTKGYPFAFQVLGYHTWENQGDFNKAFDEAYRYLAEYSYMKIFSGLSAKDRDVVFAIASSKTNQNKEIREKLSWSTNQYNPYRMRLIRKGLIDGEKYGYVYFTLPEFGQFILEYSAMLNAE
jgi:hypothetical protein